MVVFGQTQLLTFLIQRGKIGAVQPDYQITDPIKKGGKISSEGIRTALRTSSSTEIPRKLLRAVGLAIRADDFGAVAQDVLYHGKLQQLAQHLFLVCVQRLALVRRD